MDAIWAFLTDASNRTTLSWVGGGVAAVASGLWTVATFFIKAPPAKPVSPPAAPGRADRGGVVFGGGAEGATVVSGGGSVIISRGLSGWPLVALVVALAGLGVLAVSLGGNRATATNGVAVGGDVRGSAITVERP